MILRKIEFERDVELDIIVPSMKVASTSALLDALAKIVADHYKLPFLAIREHLEIILAKDSSSMGEGIIIPAMTLKNIRQSVTILISLENSIDYDSIDGQPVDLICLVISPEQEKPFHLRRLSRISRLMKNKVLAQKIRETHDSEVIQALIHSPEGWMMAA